MKKLLYIIMGMILPLMSMAQFITVEDGHLMREGKPYKFIGTNYWCAPIMASDGRGGNIERLRQELDDMKSIGVENIRILAGAEGTEDNPTHVQPVLQPQAGVYNDTLLVGLDRLLIELENRGMTAVIYMNNAWDWSGGFDTYLEWAGCGTPPEPTHWMDFKAYTAQFVVNKKTRELSNNHVKHIVSRVNSLNGKPYSESPAIMAWELCNEPRCFIGDEEHKTAFVDYVNEQSQLIKSIDKNHLVTTGSEGKYGCEVDLDLFEEIHSLPAIDYCCIHIWPYNWGWLGRYAGSTKQKKAADGVAPIRDNIAQACANTTAYIDEAVTRMKKHGKPIVVEEFGYPRDEMRLEAGSPVTMRNIYYQHVFNILAKTDKIAGCNFWSWGGNADVRHPDAWQKGDDYVGDPAQEEQGLNCVFRKDTTTIGLIKKYTGK